MGQVARGKSPERNIRCFLSKSRNAGMRLPSATLVRRRPEARGISLIETMIATLVLLTVATGLLTLFTIAIAQTEQQGNIASRTIEFSQDKMEQLMALTFNDPGLGGTMVPSFTMGAVPPAGAQTGYVDYLDQNGGALSGATGAVYVRTWSITADSTGSLKTITVVVNTNPQGGSQGIAPSTTLVCVKSN